MSSTGNTYHKQLIKSIFVFFCVLLSFQPDAQDVHYTLVNPRDIEEGSDSFHIIDVMTYSNIGFKLGSGQLYFQYDTNAFGPNVIANGHLEFLVPDSSILNERVGIAPMDSAFYGDFISNDNTFNRFSYSWQPDLSLACQVGENVNYFSDFLFTLKIKYLSGGTSHDPGICLEGEALYLDQTYTACGPVDCNSANCIDFPGMQIVTDFYSCDDCRIVYTTADSGTGSLRNAISCAFPGDTIRFASHLRMDSIMITSSVLALNKEVSILARKALQIFVRGDQVNRTFDILANGNVIIEGLQIIPGLAVSGSAIRNMGMLTLRDATIHRSASDSLLIRNNGELHIEGSTRIRQNE